MKLLQVALLTAAVLTIGVSAQSVQAQIQADDGKIVFVSDRDRDCDGASGGEIHVMNTDSTDQVRLTHNNERNFAPSWSPDGKRIAFSSYPPGGGIYLMNADGSGQTRLTDGSDWERSPSFSPDGQRIAYSAKRFREFEIYVVNVDGSDRTPITGSPESDGDPNWSPDGQRIVYSSGLGLDSEIYVTDVDGSNRERLTHSPGWDGDPNWSPDGSRIAYSSGINIYVMNTDGSGRARLTKDVSSRDIEPSWSPDGQHIAFASDRDGDFEIFVMNSDGSDQKQITHNSADDTDPSWAPSAETSQNGSTPGQAPSGDNQTLSGTFTEEGLILPENWESFKVDLVVGDFVRVTYTSKPKSVGGFAESGALGRPGVVFNVNDPIGGSIYRGEQVADGGTEFTADRSGTYEFTFFNPVHRNLQEVKLEYQIIPTRQSTPTPTPIPTATPRPSIPTPIATSPTPLAVARQTPTPQPTQTPLSAVSPTPAPPSPTPAPEPTPERGFFVNSLPSQGNSGQWDFMDPVALSIIGICLTLVGTLVQLFRGR